MTSWAFCSNSIPLSPNAITWRYAVNVVAEVGKTRYQIFLLEQKTEKNFSEIGQRIYDLISENGSKNPLSDPLVKSKLAEAKKLEKKAKILHEKMGTIRKKIA